MEAFVKLCASFGGSIRIISGLGKFTRFWRGCDPSSSIILVLWVTEEPNTRLAGWPEPQLCVEPRVWGSAPGRQAVGGEREGEWGGGGKLKHTDKVLSQTLKTHL